MAVHAVQAGAMAGKAMAMAAVASPSSDCQGCGGDGIAKDKACFVLCAAVNPAVLPAKAMVVASSWTRTAESADQNAIGLTGPPEPHPPKSDLPA